jgi:hypothetical protein
MKIFGPSVGEIPSELISQIIRKKEMSRVKTKKNIEATRNPTIRKGLILASSELASDDIMPRKT